MKWTGERLVDEHTSEKAIIEHLHRYAIALEFINKKVVLDIASGEGYGANLMADYASSVVGVDISDDAVKHASEKYKKHNLTFKKGSATNIPLMNNEIDVIVSFETIEHLREQEEMMLEFKRVLKKDGILIISSPERDNYKLIDPNNEFHVAELTLYEFKLILSRHFENIFLFHQRFLLSSFVYPADLNIGKLEEFTGDFKKIYTKEFRNAHYFNIAVCSNNDCFDVKMKATFFDGLELYKRLNVRMAQEHAEALKQTIQLVRNSASYRIGNFLISPIVFIAKLFKK